MAFTYKLEHEDGTPVDPPTFRSAVPTWMTGDTIPLGDRSLQVVDVKDEGADQAPVLAVRGRSPSGSARGRGTDDL